MKDVIVNLLQSIDQQRLSFQVSSLQIDNQLHATQYPVILSFDHDSRSNSFGLEDDDQDKCGDLHIHSQSSCESVICLTISKWRKKDMPLISFEYIIFRYELLAPFALCESSRGKNTSPPAALACYRASVHTSFD